MCFGEFNCTKIPCRSKFHLKRSTRPNPNCVEQATFSGHENPIFASIPCQYVPNFNLQQVKEMVLKLGRYMGIVFDEIVFSKLTDDFGGHPFLIRQICSLIHNESKSNRPIEVDKALYEKAKNKFIEDSKHYLDMVIQVLKDWYPDEYEMLKYLANGDLEMFNEFAEDNSNFTKHLVGYGLLQRSPNGYAFNIESVKSYVSSKHKYERINLSDSEMVEEISRRRNSLEKALRKILKNYLKMKYGRNKAAEKVLAAIEQRRRESLQSIEVDALLSDSASPLFFLDLINIIKKEWDGIQNIFEMEKNKLVITLEEINQFGRPDAHAKNLSNDEFVQLRLHFNKLEKVTENW